jgi:hypothetical protein
VDFGQAALEGLVTRTGGVEERIFIVIVDILATSQTRIWSVGASSAEST